MLVICGGQDASQDTKCPTEMDALEGPSNSQSHKGEKLRNYTISFKLKVLNYAKEKGNRDAARYFHVDRKRVREWRKNEDNFKKMHGQLNVRKRRDGAGKKVASQEIELQLLGWFKTRRDKRVRVTGKGLRKEARRLHQEAGNQQFKASCHWLRRFMHRHGISFRRATHVAQKSEVELSEKVQHFLTYVIKMRKRKNYALCDIGNMDETPVWVDMPGEYTLELKGTRSVTMKTTGYEKSRITVMLAAMADGTKLPPMVLFKGVRPPKEIPLGIHIKMTPKATSNTEVMQHWLHNVWRKRGNTRRMLVWDSFSAHITPVVKESVGVKYNTDMAVIPGGCTSKLQPCDVSWNRPFKDIYRDAYDEWLADESKVELTRGGNRKPPNRIIILKWIKEAWATISPALIRKSFLKTGISNEMDGTQDDFLFAADSSDDDRDPFEGFPVPTTAEQVQQDQMMSNMNYEVDAVNEWSDAGSVSDCSVTVSDADYDSPGH